MWPYMIRLNPLGFVVLCIICVSFYLLYSSTSLTNDALQSLKQRRREVFGNQDSQPSIDLKTLLITLIRAAERGGKEVSNVLREKHLHTKSKGKTDEGKDELLTEGDLRSHQMMVLQVSAKFPGLKIISEEKQAPEVDGYFLPFGELQDLLYADDIHQLPSSLVPMESLMVWIDPLDATQEYTENLTQYVTTMACVAVDGVATIGVIHEPFTQETYWAWKDFGLSDSLEEVVLTTEKQSRNSTKLRFIVSRSHAGDIQKEIAKVYKDDYDIISAGGSGYKTVQLIKGHADAYIHRTAIKKWDICAPNALLNSISRSSSVFGSMTDLNGAQINYTDNGDVWNKEGILATLRVDHGKLLKSLTGLKVDHN
ncbi:inositol monophosphatase 3-like [Brevipalpus obovatus]|uniref:inositol monophosphatase 3-like n=1 Tax=Brevipalpus obovatus TaxID=246614 RepID=UPI003D9EC612